MTNMVSLKTRTENPALTFHIDTYLEATKTQRKPHISIQRFIELDVVREAALIHVAITAGFIERSPIQIFLPTEIWNQCIDLINQLRETP
ncbi:hypothetical protein [Pseudanabaena sp. BC1403]|uniref:hypothetical protein n=1 Tax=Pseudanabaena sp. BC1403 TaxID=2043171 RepID=UPI0011AF0D07|nr:hypothetical protein [Pseudanabaena sp. BC1403]